MVLCRDRRCFERRLGEAAVTDETWAVAVVSRPVRPVATRPRNLPGPRR